MKNREIVERILAYHPNLPNYDGCDNWKCGDPEAECTGIVTALVPTVNVIRETARLGANLLIVHEPTFYTSQDGPGWFEDFPNEVYEEKKKLLDEAGKLHLEKAGLMAYSHGEYFAMGKKIGSFGYSVRKKRPKNPAGKKKK